jgi:hypothetical protein
MDPLATAASWEQPLTAAMRRMRLRIRNFTAHSRPALARQ